MAITNNFPEKRGLNADDINEIMSSGEIAQGNFVQSQTCYSTSETVVGKWIDGKPLYQKTFVYAPAIPADTNNTSTGFYITDIEELVALFGTFDNSNAQYHTKFEIGRQCEVYVIYDTGEIVVNTGRFGCRNLRMTAQYTKTTD